MSMNIEQPPSLEAAAAFFESYLKRKVDEATLAAHLEKIRQKAVSVHSFRCVVEGRFFAPRIVLHPKYPVIQENIEKKRIIDIGCALGTDLRKFLVDGAKLENLVAVDQHEEFWNLGLEMFEDMNSELGKSSVFVCADFLALDFLSKLRMTDFDVVYMGSILHLLNEEQVKRSLMVASSLLSRRNGVLLGRTVGIENSSSAVSLPTDNNPERVSRFLHSPDSLKKVLEACGFQNIEITWTVRNREGERNEEWRLMCFYAERVASQGSSL